MSLTVEVTQIKQSKPAFVPFNVTIAVNTIEEAAAIRALWGGSSVEAYNKIAEGACRMKTTGEDIASAAEAIGTAVHAELFKQGIL